MSPKGRPEGEYRSAQHEGNPVRARETFEVAVIGGGLVGAAIAGSLLRSRRRRVAAREVARIEPPSRQAPPSGGA